MGAVERIENTAQVTQGPMTRHSHVAWLTALGHIYIWPSSVDYYYGVWDLDHWQTRTMKWEVTGSKHCPFYFSKCYPNKLFIFGPRTSLAYVKLDTMHVQLQRFILEKTVTGLYDHLPITVVWVMTLRPYLGVTQAPIVRVLQLKTPSPIW